MALCFIPHFHLLTVPPDQTGIAVRTTASDATRKGFDSLICHFIADCGTKQM
jgi:hypothetical protein